MKTITFRLLVAAAALSAISTNDLARAAEQGPVLSLSAVAVGPDDPAGPEKTRTGSVTIVIERWSVEGETARVGVIQTGSRVIAEIRQAREEWDKGAKTRRIVITTDRPMSAWDVATQADTANNASAVPVEAATFEIRLTRYGTGEGRLMTGPDLRATSDPAAADSYSTRPLRLTAISTDRKDSIDRH